MKNDVFFLTWAVPGLTLQEAPPSAASVSVLSHAPRGKPAIRETSILIISKIKDVQAWLSETGNIFPHIKPFKHASPLQVTLALLSPGGSSIIPGAGACERFKHKLLPGSLPETWKPLQHHYTCLLQACKPLGKKKGTSLHSWPLSCFW